MTDIADSGTPKIEGAQAEALGTGDCRSEGAIERSLRETARSLLEDGRVDLVIGYEQGTLPLRTTPCFVRSPEEVERLVWNPLCENNLATYLRTREERVAVVAKGCDVRSIVGLIMERQLARDNVFLIGVPCQGVIDRLEIEQYLGGMEWASPVEILEATLGDAAVGVAGEAADGNRFEEHLPMERFLCDACLTCEDHIPRMYDILIGDLVSAIEAADSFSDVGVLEAQGSDERWTYFSQEFSRCIRCYACREACPLCYCQECFIDQTQPCWFGKTDDPSDTLIFHIVRALHVAGRCVDCGACSRACPMGLNLRILNRKMIKDISEWYDYRAGRDLEAIPLLATFRPDDPQEFIR